MVIRDVIYTAGLGAVLVVGAGQALADQWTSPVTVTGVQAGNTTGNSSGSLEVYITTSQTVMNPADCVATDGYVTIDPVIANSVYAGALSARAMGANVQFYVSGSLCAANRPMIISFQVD